MRRLRGQRERGAATFTAAANALRPPAISLCWIFILFAENKLALHFSTPLFPPHPTLSICLGLSSMSWKSRAGAQARGSGNSSLRSKRAFPRTPGPARPCVPLPLCCQRSQAAQGSWQFHRPTVFGSEITEINNCGDVGITHHLALQLLEVCRSVALSPFTLLCSHPTIHRQNFCPIPMETVPTKH